jgi:hypothetical protein
VEYKFLSFYENELFVIVWSRRIYFGL